MFKSGHVYTGVFLNGAGKTTILKMIATLLRPTTGEILINGMNAVRCEKRS